MSYGIEHKVVDDQGRIVLPADWRSEELKDNREVFVIKGKGFLKIIPKKKIDLTKYFDQVDLGANIDNWSEFEQRFNEK